MGSGLWVAHAPEQNAEVVGLLNPCRNEVAVRADGQATHLPPAALEVGRLRSGDQIPNQNVVASLCDARHATPPGGQGG